MRVRQVVFAVVHVVVVVVAVDSGRERLTIVFEL